MLPVILFVLALQHGAAGEMIATLGSWGATGTLLFIVVALLVFVVGAVLGYRYFTATDEDPRTGTRVGSRGGGDRSGET